MFRNVIETLKNSYYIIWFVLKISWLVFIWFEFLQKTMFEQTIISIYGSEIMELRYRSSFDITCLYDVSTRSLLYPNSFRWRIIYHWSMGCQCTSQWWCITELLSKRGKVFKNGPSKICGRRPLRCLKSDMVCREIIYHLKFFKGFLPQILLGPF